MFLTLSVFIIFSIKGISGTDCPDGFESHHGICYLFSHGKETWIGAFKSCKLFDAMLVEVDTADEDLYLSSKTRALGDDYWWISLTDKQVEGEYIWETSKRTLGSAGYTNWGPTEPDSKGSENCVFYAPSRNNMWADAECTRETRYICEKQPSSAQIIG